MSTALALRALDGQADVDAIERITRLTGFFSEEEVGIARELGETCLLHGEPSGYLISVAELPAASSSNAEARIVGYSCFGPIPATESSYDVYWIVVDPTLQGQGVGRELLQHSEGIARARGARRIYIDTASRPQYAPTHRFYERCGYTQAAFLQDFYAPGDGKVIFVRAL
jgi:GNAT superfamily N-acetyltransferase